MDLSEALSQELAKDLAGFPEVIGYPPDCDPSVIASSVLRRTLLKKYQGREAADADELALGKFLDVNQRVAGWELGEIAMEERELVGCFKKHLYNFFYHHDEDTSPVVTMAGICSRGYTGPGASLGARGTDMYTKLFSGPLTTTSDSLYLMYKSYISSFPRWVEAESSRASMYGIDVVASSKLSFVPKDATISRTICTEPVLNMYFQLGLGRVLAERIRERFKISLSDQPMVNKRLAREGSVSGRFATIDLASASDSISCQMLRYVLPRQVYAWLDLFRTPSTETPKGVVELGMISTMGNGFTFPLQTTLFCCVVAACYEHLGIALRKNDRRSGIRKDGSSWSSISGANFGVFGDDIIVEQQAASLVIRLLEILGFETNRNKTFVEGPFRESCGGDYYRGSPCRGVYIKHLKTDADRYVAINLLINWSAMTGIYLPHCVQFLYGTVRDLRIPLSCPIESGIRVPYGFAPKGRDRNGSVRVTLLRPRSYKLRMEVDDDKAVTAIVAPRGLKTRSFNADGLLLAFLTGGVRGYAISVRNPEVVYHTKRGVIPNWNYVPRAQAHDPVGLWSVNDRWGVSQDTYLPEGVDWRRWDTVASCHFGMVSGV